MKILLTCVWHCVRLGCGIHTSLNIDVFSPIHVSMYILSCSVICGCFPGVSKARNHQNIAQVIPIAPVIHKITFLYVMLPFIVSDYYVSDIEVWV